SAAVWESFVLVHLDPDPPPVETYLGALVGQIAPLGLGALQFFERREYVLGCNWKVFVDNYLDGGYHVPHLHHGLGSILDYTHYTIETFDRSCLQSAPIDAGGGEAATASSARSSTSAATTPPPS
ncbi:MAG TPA: SRPBCC family protein, partial [Kofleriaceae bacterium]|nr:SRPBCC family protein [Kofleriaceae bacterium]